MAETARVTPEPAPPPPANVVLARTRDERLEAVPYYEAEFEHADPVAGELNSVGQPLFERTRSGTSCTLLAVLNTAEAQGLVGKLDVGVVYRLVSEFLGRAGITPPADMLETIQSQVAAARGYDWARTETLYEEWRGLVDDWDAAWATYRQDPTAVPEPDLEVIAIARGWSGYRQRNPEREMIAPPAA